MLKLLRLLLLVQGAGHLLPHVAVW